MGPIDSTLTGKANRMGLIKEDDKKGHVSDPKSKEPPGKNVQFHPDIDTKEMDQSNKESETITDSELESAIIARAPSRLVGKPLKDFDSGNGRIPCKNTFLVLRRRGRSRADHVYRFNKARSLYLLGPFHPIRLFAISVVTNRYFEFFVILTILANCVFLVVECSPEQAEYVFSGIYTVEMILKILSRGFILHSYAYLRDPWNWLDFIVVVLGYITLAPNIVNFTAIRTIRVLRALRTFSALKGLRAMVNTLLRSLKLLSDVLVLFLFFLGVIALIGLQLFSGELMNKCVLNAAGNESVNYEERALNESLWYIHDGEPLLCGNGSSAGSCPTNYTCLPNAGPNPDNGYTTFDNIGWSLVMALQILTMDFWENLYDKIVRAAGAFFVPYFVIGIFFCSFYLMNLVLAVVYLSYEQELCSVDKQREMQKIVRRTAASYQADEQTIKHLKLLIESCSPRPENDGVKDETLPVCKEIGSNHSKPRHCLVPGCVGKRRAGTSKQVQCEVTLSDESCPKLLRKRMSEIIAHPVFDAIIMALILLNTIILALYHHGIDPHFERILDIVNLVFTVLFIVELLFRFVAMGPMAFICSRWNVFDTTVVTGSMLGYFYKSADGLSIFRTLRLVRVLCLAKSWKTMERLMKAISRSVGPVGNITLILGVVVYIFAVVGIKIFGHAYTADKFGEDGVPRWNFNDFWHAFMTVFRVLCGEWIEPLWDCMRATNPSQATLFFLIVLIVGNFIVLNLFVALLVNAFDFRESDISANEVAQTADNQPKCSLKKMLQTRKSRLFVAKYREPLRLYELQVLESSCCSSKDAGLLAICDQAGQRKEPYDASCKEGPSDIENAMSMTDPTPVNGTNLSPTPPERYVVEIDDCLPENCMDLPVCNPFSPRNLCWLKFRCRVRVLVEKKWFEWFILVTVFFSSFTLIFEDIHLPNKPKLARTLEILNYVFAAIFTAEFIMKTIGLGIVKYFSSAWNCLDAFIVSISLACAFEDKNLSVFRSLRTLRALRPLRAISRLEGMKVVVNAFFAAIPGIGNVLLVSLLFWLIFSILGVHLFAGKFYKCVDIINKERLPPDQVANKTECLKYPERYRWINSKVTFDNVLAGFLALLQVATFEGWMEVMEDAVDSTKVDVQPKYESNMTAYCFFVAFIIVGSFFVLNLFVGVIIDNFNNLKKKYEELNSMGMLLTDSQRKWVNFLKEAARKKPPTRHRRPQNRVRGVLYDLVTGDRFEIAILTVIMCNMIMMMIQHHGQSPQITSVLRLSNFVFTGIFVLEAIVKIITLHLHYFKKAWNVFDLVIVISSLVDIILDELSTSDAAVSPSLLRVLRIFRIARLLRLVEFASGIRRLLWALMISLPALFNIGTLLFMVIFIYAIIGMSAFGHVKREGGLNDITNFETFGHSLLLLFRLSTGSGWNDIMDALLLKPPDCDPNFMNLPHGNCGSFGAIVFLSSYVIIVFLVIVNMYIAIILENVNRAHEIEDFCITKEHFDSYYMTWGSFVPDGKQYIPMNRLCDFVASLDKPFKIPIPNAMTLNQLDIPLRTGELIHCFDLLKALVRRVLEEHGESAEVFKDITSRMEARFNKLFSEQRRISSLPGSTRIKLRLEVSETVT